MKSFRLLARLPLMLVGFVGMVWAAQFGPTFWRYGFLDGIASSVIRSDNVSAELLDGSLPALNNLQQSQICLPKAMHSASIIRGRLVQVAIDNSDPDQIQASVAAANAMVRKSLSCAPADPFLWFTLFWLEGLQGRFADQTVDYLWRSYELGPYEGWIGLRRNKYGLIVYPLLPSKLQRRVVAEYVALLNSGFVAEAAANLSGAGWPIHETLLSAIADVRPKYKRLFAMTLRRSGIEVEIPGLVMPELRPWQVD